MTLDEYLVGKPYTLSEEQYKYCDDVISGTGHVANFSPAGTGKSLCLEVIKGVLGDTCVICATTGIANSILFDSKGGQGTCHSVFSLPTEIHNEFHEKKVFPLTSSLFARSDLVKVVIVEEAAMLNPDGLALIVKRLERFNRAYGKKRKKRKIRLVLQGDFLQLGTVYTKQFEIDYMRKTYGSELLFESTPFTSLSFNIHLFWENRRASNKTFQAFLDVLRYGQEKRYEKALQWINKRYVKAPEGIPVITTTNKKVEELNRLGLENNPNDLVILKPDITGKYNISDCPAGKEIHIKIGSPVISLMNDQCGEFFNGSSGTVTGFSYDEGVYVKFDHSGKEVLVPMFTYENREYFTDTKEDGTDFMNSKLLGTCTHTPIKVNYASTAFRVQGKTLSCKTLIDMGWGFPESQDNPWGMQKAYVICSRLTDVNNLYLTHPLTKKHLKVNRRAVNWVLSHTDS